LKPIKILYISPQTGGGSIESLLQLILNLDPEKYSSAVLFERHADETLRSRFVAAGASVADGRKIIIEPLQLDGQSGKRPLRKNIKRHVGPSIVRAYAELHSAWQAARQVVPRAIRMSRIIKDESPDIVHVNSAPHDGLAGLLAARFARIPCVCHVRNMSNVSVIQRVLSASVQKFIFISSEVQRNLATQKIGAKNGVVIFNGVDVSAFQQSDEKSLREEIGVAEDAFLVGMVGRLEHWKGHKIFIDAVHQLSQAGENLRALIIGGPQPGPRNKKYYDSLISQIRRHNLQNIISLLGQRDDIPDVMSQLDILVLASTKPEPFGRVIIEAMAAETLVVATAGGGVLDIIRDGENGILVPAGDSLALATAIQRARRHSGESPRLVTNALADVGRRFTADRCADNVSNIYDQILATKSSQHRRISKEHR